MRGFELLLDRMVELRRCFDTQARELGKHSHLSKSKVIERRSRATLRMESYHRLVQDRRLSAYLGMLGFEASNR